MTLRAAASATATLTRPTWTVLGRATTPPRTSALRLPCELFRLVQQHHRRPSTTRHYASVSASELQFGQPVYETHPHILKSGESTSCLPPSTQTNISSSSRLNSLSLPPSSNTRHHSPRISRPTRPTRSVPTPRCRRHPPLRRHQVALRRRLPPLPPGLRLPLPDRFQRARGTSRHTKHRRPARRLCLPPAGPPKEPRRGAVVRALERHPGRRGRLQRRPGR